MLCSYIRKLRSSPKQPEAPLYFSRAESILLLTESEAITQNIGERLAFLVGSDADSRLRVKKVVAEAYAVRSSFVHHGERVEDFDLTGCRWLVGTAYMQWSEMPFTVLRRRKNF